MQNECLANVKISLVFWVFPELKLGVFACVHTTEKKVSSQLKFIYYNGMVWIQHFQFYEYTILHMDKVVVISRIFTICKIFGIPFFEFGTEK